MPAPAVSTPASVAGSRWRHPVQAVHISSSPSTTSVPSVARPISDPAQPGASAAPWATDR
ncbi:hypothetical protein [Streptomyces sp. NPDC046261]|uniref:hypothetical protein n=1 Tax=Streptomyces sp. NPDC046261 TaxID=3157200 RepID=UPI0033F4AF9D